MTKTNKKAGVQPIGRTEKLYSRFVWQKVLAARKGLRFRRNDERKAGCLAKRENLRQTPCAPRGLVLEWKPERVNEFP